MVELQEYVDKPINSKRINIFHGSLVENHIGIPHPIMKIPAKYTLLDALCYVYDNDLIAVAECLQAKQDNVDHAIELLEALEDGIRTKTICLTCVKESMSLMRRCH